MKRLFTRLIALGALLAVLAGGAAWLTRQTRVKWTLPDGSTLEVLKVTWGTSHYCRCGNRLVDYFYPLAPDILRKRIRFRVATISRSAPGGPVVWLRQSDKNDWSVCRFTVMDHAGVESVPADAARQGWISETAELMAMVPTSYPRSEESVRLRISTPPPKSVFVTELRLPNRNRRRPSAAPVEPLPASRRAGRLEVRLVKLETGLLATTAGSSATSLRDVSRANFSEPESERCYSRARFDLRENGVEASGWVINNLVLSNADGEVREFVAAALSPPKPKEVNFPAGLWLDESAWNLKVGLLRVAEFPQDQIWVAGGLPVTTKGISTLQGGTNLNGAAVKLESIRILPESPVGLFPGELRGTVWLSSRSSVYLSALGIKDNHGRQGWISAGGSAMPGPSGYASPAAVSAMSLSTQEAWSFDFALPERDAETVEVTFGISQVVHVEFWVKPVLGESTNGITQLDLLPPASFAPH
jgi:hypothetical protein